MTVVHGNFDQTLSKSPVTKRIDCIRCSRFVSHDSLMIHNSGCSFILLCTDRASLEERKSGTSSFLYSYPTDRSRFRVHLTIAQAKSVARFVRLRREDKAMNRIVQFDRKVFLALPVIPASRARSGALDGIWWLRISYIRSAILSTPEAICDGCFRDCTCRLYCAKETSRERASGSCGGGIHPVTVAFLRPSRRRWGLLWSGSIAGACRVEKSVPGRLPTNR